MPRTKFKTSDSKSLILLPQHRQLENIAVDFLQKWGLSKWKFAWDDSKTILGRCFYQYNTITLSKYYCLFLSEQENKDTILHEIAHALTWEQYKKDLTQVPSAYHAKMGKDYLSHNLVWQLMCKKVGAKPQACYSGEIRIPKI